MERSIEYAHVMSNFDSVYNAPLNIIPQPTTYVPLYTSLTLSSLTNRPSSPLFRRSISPPPRPRLFLEPGPKFNFDLYKTDDNTIPNDGYCSPSSYRSLSPSSSSIIYHRRIHSPPPPPSSTSKSHSLSKLRQLNDELCQTLARSDLNNPSPPPPPPRYHIHHYPLSQHPNQTYRARSPNAEYVPSIESEVSPNLHKARVTYKIHFPKSHRQERHEHHKSFRHPSPSDVSSNDDPMIVDLYPTKDRGFVKQIRKHADYESPWVVDGTSLRRGSFSDTSTSRSPKGPYYGDKSIKSHRRSTRSRERPSSSSRRQSVSSRVREHVWHPPSKNISDRPPKYFEPTLKSEYDTSTRRRTTVDGTESEPVSQRRTLSNQTRIRHGDSKLKKRIANAESKVKSAWEPTITGLSQPTVRERKPSIPHPVKQTTMATPPKSKVKPVPSEPTTPVKKVITLPPQPPTTISTGPSLSNDVPTKPIFESTPKNQSTTNKHDDNVDDLFDNESEVSKRSSKKEEPQPAPHNKTSTLPRKPSTELPKPSVPQPDKDTKSTVKDDGDGNQLPSSTTDINNTHDTADDDEDKSDAHSEQPTPKVPTPERKASLPKGDSKKTESVIDDDDDENDQEVASSFDIEHWLNGASKDILAGAKQGETTPRSEKPPPPPPTARPKSPPRRKEHPPSPARESPDHNLYKPPFGPKKTEQKRATPPPTGEAVEVDDFFS